MPNKLESFQINCKMSRCVDNMHMCRSQPETKCARLQIVRCQVGSCIPTSNMENILHIFLFPKVFWHFEYL